MIEKKLPLITNTNAIALTTLKAKSVFTYTLNQTDNKYVIQDKDRL